MAKSPLQEILSKWKQSGGNIAYELYDLGYYPVVTVEDAQEICDVLGLIDVRESENGSKYSVSSLNAILELIQKAESDPAFDILSKEGLPRLSRIFDEGLAELDLRPQDPSFTEMLLLILKIFAIYRYHEGIPRIVRALHRPLGSEPHLLTWSEILLEFKPGHPHWRELFEALRSPLPHTIIGAAYMDWANWLAFEGTLTHHPYDCPEGKDLLTNWITSENPDHFSCAHSATAALPFISEPGRSQLIELAWKHKDKEVRLESAWALAKCDEVKGIALLNEFAGDPDLQDKAQSYLTELKRGNIAKRDHKR